MKIESLNDVQTIPAVDQLAPVTAASTKPSVATGGDDLAFRFTQEVEPNSQALNQRSIGKRVKPVDHYADLYELLGYPAQLQLSMISREVRKALQGGADVPSLLKMTEGDPARLHVVLKYVEAQEKDEHRDDGVRQACAALSNLETQYRGEILAGLNTAQVMKAASGDPQERLALRKLYYSSVVTRQSLVAMMQALLSVYCGEQLGVGLLVMRRALADDIAAKSSSIPSSTLRTLMLGLQDCSHLSCVLSTCRALIQRLNAQHDPVALLQALLEYTSSGMTPGEIVRFGRDLSGDNPVMQAICFNALYPLFKELPLVLWRDKRSREELLHKFLVVLDEVARSTNGIARPVGGLRRNA